MNLFVEMAINFAYVAHDGQFRLDEKTPFVTHPLDVYERLKKSKDFEKLNKDYGWIYHEVRGASLSYSNIVLSASVLHDVVEDTIIKIDEIDEKFGLAVATLVKDLTRQDDESYLDYIIRVKNSKWVATKVIKKYDLISNYIDTELIPSHKGGMKRGLQTKYELAFYILTGESIKNYID